MNEPRYTKPYLWWPAFSSSAPGPLWGIPMVTPEEQERTRNGAAVRVRARRRINLALGVYPLGQTRLAPLLQAATKLEAYERMRQLW
jgi:hypothetical protein